MSLRRALCGIPRALHTTSALRELTLTVPRPAKAESIAETEVPVVAYTEGSDQPYHAVLKVDQSKIADTTGPIVDVAKAAFAVEKDIALKLPPTLRKFMLDGKVALVTGYVKLFLYLSILRAFANSAMGALNGQEDALVPPTLHLDTFSFCHHDLYVEITATIFRGCDDKFSFTKSFGFTR